MQPAMDIIGWRGFFILFTWTSATVFVNPFFSKHCHSGTMEEEERPRKLPKLNHDQQQEELKYTMTGAVGGVDTKEAGDAENAELPPPKDEKRSSIPPGGADTGVAKEAEAPKISKNQLKKQRRHEQWAATKDRRKEKRKEKMAEKKQRKRNELEEAKRQGTGAELLRARLAEKERRKHSILLPVTFVVDCSFDDLMTDKELVSLGSQVTRCYSDNSKAAFRSHLVVSSFEKMLKQRFDTVLAKSHENWHGIRFMQEDYLQAAEMAKEWMKEPEKGGRMAGVFTDYADAKPEDGEVIYLSSESPHILTELKPYSTYVVGGLVDKNRHKGICYNQAMEKGIKTARLPIGDYIQMRSRQVLTTNHVVEIMLRWLELGDWGKAFMQVLPRRKGGTLMEQEADVEDPEGHHKESEEPGSSDPGQSA